jgi:CheY-like chemotaxis protein
MAQLLNAHEYAVPPLLIALNDPSRKNVHARAKDTLMALGQDAIAPLLATLEGPDGGAKVAAIRTLGRIGAAQATGRLVGIYASPKSSADVRSAAREAIVDLHGKIPTAKEAAAYLERETRALLSGQRQIEPLLDGEVDAWVWDAEKNQPIPASLTAEQVRSRLALQLARRLYESSPDNREYRQLYLVSLLAAEAHRVGRDSPVSRAEGSAFATAAALGVATVEGALSFALEHDQAAAATVAAKVLGEIGDIAMLARGAEPAPLAQALAHDDQRLRFAAAQAIVKQSPAENFPGSSRLKSVLVSFATSFGERHALIGFPNAETAANLAGMVGSLGFETAIATSGRELLLKATQDRHHDLILISSRIDRAPLYLVLQDLRNHPPTAATPIIVLAEDDELGELRERWDDDPLSSVVLRPRSLEGMKYAVDTAIRRAGDRIVPPEVREQQAAEAIRSIAALSASAPKHFSFRDFEQELLPLLYLPALGPLTAEVVDGFGTHGSQQALLAIINRTSQPLASRQAATLAFGESVRRFGVRLTKDEILRQYDRYNASKFEDAATQQLLGAVLDAIEFRARAGLEATAHGE